MIPQFNLDRQYDSIKEEITIAIERVLTHKMYCLGDEVKKFEEELANYIGVKYAVGVGSGSAALWLSLIALGIGPGDEVITPSNSYIATTFAITHTGATPVFVDINDYYNIDANLIVKKITNKTKAILPVHLYGQSCQIDAIKEIADIYHLFVVEDCAQAIGATFKNQKIGSFGDLGCFSFYPSKNLGCYGDGGIVTTNDEELYNRLISLRNDGRRKEKYIHYIEGYNERLDAIQAAILSVKLKHLDGWNNKRIKIANLYQKYLSSNNNIILPERLKNAKHVYHQFVIRIKNRDKVKQILWDKYQIGTGIHYPIPIHKQEAYKEFNNEYYLNIEKYTKQILSLPMYPELTKKEVVEICKKLRGILR